MLDTRRLLYVRDVPKEVCDDVVVKCFASFGEFMPEELCINHPDSGQRAD